MKRLSALLLLLIPAICFGQGLPNNTPPLRRPPHGTLIIYPVQVPAKIKAAFDKLYPNTKVTVRWGKSDSDYVASFTDQSFKSVCFDTGGNWLLTEMLLPQTFMLPKGPIEYTNKHYGTWETTGKYYRISSADGTTTYCINMVKDLAYCNLIFDAQGKFLKRIDVPAAKQWKGVNADLIEGY